MATLADAFPGMSKPPVITPQTWVRYKNGTWIGTFARMKAKVFQLYVFDSKSKILEPWSTSASHSITNINPESGFSKEQIETMLAGHSLSDFEIIDCPIKS